MKKKIFLIVAIALIICIAIIAIVIWGLNTDKSNDEPLYDTNQKVNARDVPWEVKMGITDYGDRALIIKFTNNSNYIIKEISLNFTMKDNIDSNKLDEFYTYISEEYELSEEDIQTLKKKGIEMNAWVYLLENEYIQKGATYEESLCYGYKYILTMDYFDLFRPDIYKIVYINESNEECTVYYDYINRTYSNK